MHQTKLIQVLSRFDKSETKQFEAFLASPYFNTSDKLLSFYKLIIAYHPLFESSRLDKESIYKKLHGKSAYNDQTMRELISSLFKLAKEFISHQQLKATSINASNKRYEWFYEKGLIKLSEQELVHSEDMLRHYEGKDYEYYYQRWLTDFNAYHYRSEMMRDMEHKLLKTLDFTYHMHSLDRYYLLRFLESYVYMLNISKIYNLPVDASIGSHIDTMAEKYIGQGYLLVDIMYYIYRLLTTGDEQFFHELKSIFLTHDGSVSVHILTEVSINLENYCVQKLRGGDAKYQKEIMQLYHSVVEQEMMIENGELRYSFYKNVITMGMESGEMEWVREFAEKYRSKLPEPYAEEVYNFCKAYILFGSGKFEEALSIATTLGAFNDFTKIDIKNLIARLHYELEMYEQLDILLDTFSYHLNRDTVTTARKENNLLFSSFMKEMVRLSQQYSVSSWEKLSEQIRVTPAFSHKPWFMEKMAEMRIRHSKKV